MCYSHKGNCYNLPVGLSFEKFLILLLVLFIFINPKDMPSYIKAAFRLFYTAKHYLLKIKQKTKEEFLASFGDTINNIKEDIASLDKQHYAPIGTSVARTSSQIGTGGQNKETEQTVGPDVQSAASVRFDTQAT